MQSAAWIVRKIEREAEKGNPEIVKHLTDVDKRLDKVLALVNQLEAQRNADAKVLAAQTAAISAELKANNDAAQSIDSNFYNMDSSSYYSTGEGHFVD